MKLIKLTLIVSLLAFFATAQSKGLPKDLSGIIKLEAKKSAPFNDEGPGGRGGN